MAIFLSTTKYILSIVDNLFNSNKKLDITEISDKTTLDNLLKINNYEEIFKLMTFIRTGQESLRITQDLQCFLNDNEDDLNKNNDIMTLDITLKQFNIL